MTLKRARVTFADKKNSPTLHGQSIVRAEGDYDEASGILWNVRKHAKGVDPLLQGCPIGVHFATGNQIQFVTAGAEEAQRTPQEIVDALEGVDDPADRGGIEADAGEVVRPEPAPRLPKVENVPVTEAAKRAVAKREAERAATK